MLSEFFHTVADEAGCRIGSQLHHGIFVQPSFLVQSHIIRLCTNTYRENLGIGAGGSATVQPSKMTSIPCMHISAINRLRRFFK
jgi:hypothetical protein